MVVTSRAIGDPQGANGFHAAVSCLWLRGGFTAEHCPGRGDGIHRVRLAMAASALAIGAVDLDDLYFLRLQIGRQTGPIGAGALDTDARQLAEAPQPAQCTAIAGWRGGKRALRISAGCDGREQ